MKKPIEETLEKLEAASHYKGTKITDETYYDVGNIQEIVASNSFFSAINPSEGGSFGKADLFLSGQEEKLNSRTIEKGKMLHRWCRNNRDFVVFEGDKPSDAVSLVMETLVAKIPEIATKGLSDPELRQQVIDTTREVGWNNRYGDDALYKNINKEGAEYFAFLVDPANQGKTILQKDVRESLEGMQNGIHNLPEEYTEIILDSKKNVLKEFPVFANIRGVMVKILTDNLIVQEDHLHLLDLKSTGYGVSRYMGGTRAGRLSDGTPGIIYEDGSFQRNRTYRQLGTYAEVLNSVTGLPVRCTIIAVDSKQPFEAMPYDIDTRYVTLGIEEMQQCIQHTRRYIAAKGTEEF